MDFETGNTQIKTSARQWISKLETQKIGAAVDFETGNPKTPKPRTQNRPKKASDPDLALGGLKVTLFVLRVPYWANQASGGGFLTLGNQAWENQGRPWENPG